MESTFRVNSFSARILFDFGASYSFISQCFMHRLHVIFDSSDIPLSVATPLGDFFYSRVCIFGIRDQLRDVQFMVDLIVLFMSEFDVILRMN